MRGPGVAASAPTRIDFAGGTLDIPPLYLFHQPACTINVAITLRARVTVRRRDAPGITVIARDRRTRARWPSIARISWRGRPEVELVGRLLRYFAPEGGLEIETDCQAPAGAGTGGSSALAVSATAALARAQGLRLGGERLIELARGIETQTIRVPTGYQDYYAAVYGGASAVAFSPDGIARSPIADADFLGVLDRHLLLLYTGRPRFSGANNWALFRAHMEGDRKVHRFFDELRGHALAMREAFAARDIRAVARVLSADWAIRRRMLPTMSTPAIDGLIRAALSAGGLGARVCGAGGGGCLALLVEPEARPRVMGLAAAHGAEVLPCRVQRTGLQVQEATA